MEKTAPSSRSLRPSLTSVLTHALIYLTRCGTLAALAALLVVEPLYTKWYLQLPFIQSLGKIGFFVFTFAIVCHALPWACFNGFYMFCESLNPVWGTNPLKRLSLFAAFGRYMAQFKLPRQTVQLPSKELLTRTVAAAAFDQYLVVPFILYMMAKHLVHLDELPPRGTPILGFSPSDIDAYKAGENLSKFGSAFAMLALHFMTADLVNEVGFFLAHGALHSHPTLYRVFHKKHHEYKGTVSISAEYATPLEEIAANLAPSVGYFAFFFMYFTNGHHSTFVQTARSWPVFITWIWARLWETFESHSGYCFADTLLGKLGFLHGHRTRFHDFHHTHNVGNYGAGILMDGLFGTMDSYLRHRREERHKGTKESSTSAALRKSK